MRIVLAWISLLFLFGFAHIQDSSFRIGIPFVALGELIRLWAGGFQERKGKVLVTNGPYAFLRNPLYLGNFLIGIGIVLITRNTFLLLAFVIGFLWIYSKVVRREEEELLKKFGELYHRYLNAVPRFFPRLSAYPHRTQMSFQWNRLRKHREYFTLAGIVALLSGMYAWERFVPGSWVRLSWKVTLAVMAMTLLTFLALLEWSLRASVKD